MVTLLPPTVIVWAGTLPLVVTVVVQVVPFTNAGCVADTSQVIKPSVSVLLKPTGICIVICNVLLVGELTVAYLSAFCAVITP